MLSPPGDNEMPADTRQTAEPTRDPEVRTEAHGTGNTVVREDAVKEPGDSRDGAQTRDGTWGHTCVPEAGRRAGNKAG